MFLQKRASISFKRNLNKMKDINDFLIRSTADSVSFWSGGPYLIRIASRVQWIRKY